MVIVHYGLLLHFVAKNRQPFTLAHELLHLLRDAGHYDTREINLMKAGYRSLVDSIHARKRLYPADQTAVIDNTHTTE
jgi:hypothetical protein